MRPWNLRICCSGWLLDSSYHNIYKCCRYSYKITLKSEMEEYCEQILVWHLWWSLWLLFCAIIYINRFEVKMDKFKGTKKIWTKESNTERDSNPDLHSKNWEHKPEKNNNSWWPMLTHQGLYYLRGWVPRYMTPIHHLLNFPTR